MSDSGSEKSDKSGGSKPTGSTDGSEAKKSDGGGGSKPSEGTSSANKSEKSAGGGGGGSGGKSAGPPPTEDSSETQASESAVKPDDEGGQGSPSDDQASPTEDSPTGDQAAPSPSGSGSSEGQSGSKPGSGGRGKPTRRKKNEKLDLTNVRIGILGAGKMAEALMQGLINYAKVEPARIFVTSKSGRNFDHFKEKGCQTTKRLYDVFARHDCDVFFFAFHGFVIKLCFSGGGTQATALTTNFIPNMRHPIYFLSLVGGIPLEQLNKCLLNPEHPEKYKLQAHRIMLNTAIAHGNGLGAIDIQLDSKKCAPLVRDLLTSFAKIESLPESQMDVACAVGGNGLAICYYFIAAMSDGAFKMGLPKAMAVKLAAKTLLSASLSLLESGKHPSDLRDSCISPSGPAIYGIHLLDKKDCTSGLAGAVEATFRRIKQLAVESPQ